jgi:hypothetical protein
MLLLKSVLDNKEPHTSTTEQRASLCQEETLDGTQGRKLGAVSRESAIWRKATRVRTGPRFRP